MNQNISHRTTSDNQIPACMAPVKVSDSEIDSLVNWVRQSKKVSWFEASTIHSTAAIDAAIKRGYLLEVDKHLVLPTISQEVMYTPQLTTHALVHLTQATNAVNETFFEQLPNPTVLEALAAVFGGASMPLTVADRKEIIIRTQNKHAQIRAEVEAEELAQLEAKKQADQIEQEKVLHTNEDE